MCSSIEEINVHIYPLSFIFHTFHHHFPRSGIRLRFWAIECKVVTGGDPGEGQTHPFCDWPGVGERRHWWIACPCYLRYMVLGRVSVGLWRGCCG
ncbi:hypothetical protein E2C01_091087 [Portunus trituberculatus]|uniref:Uncharacterized protein n=1 Tax=Portunus trituberculatus TaxID=210409 RepID=A0A5B7JS26_PORTR|nr:hypothetical protein [Portunus trituberculatus]